MITKTITVSQDDVTALFKDIAHWQSLAYDLQLADESLIINCKNIDPLLADTLYASIQGWNTGPNNTITINFLNGYRMSNTTTCLQINEAFVIINDFDCVMSPVIDDRSAVIINAFNTIGLITLNNPKVECVLSATKHPRGIYSNSNVKTVLNNPEIFGFKDSRPVVDGNNRSWPVVVGTSVVNMEINNPNFHDNYKNRIVRDTNGGTVVVNTGATIPPITPPVTTTPNPIYGLGTAALSVNAIQAVVTAGFETNDVTSTRQKQGAMYEVVSDLGDIEVELIFRLPNGKPVQAMVFGGLSNSQNTIDVLIYNYTTSGYDELATLKGTDNVVITPESFIRVTPDHVNGLGFVKITFIGTGLVPDTAGNEAKLVIEQAFVNYVQLVSDITVTGGGVDNSAAIVQLQSDIATVLNALAGINTNIVENAAITSSVLAVSETIKTTVTGHTKKLVDMKVVIDAIRGFFRVNP